MSLFQWKETSLEINDWKLKCVLETPDEAGAAAASAAPTVAVTNSGSHHVAINNKRHSYVGN